MCRFTYLCLIERSLNVWNMSSSASIFLMHKSLMSHSNQSAINKALLSAASPVSLLLWFLSTQYRMTGSHGESKIHLWISESCCSAKSILHTDFIDSGEGFVIQESMSVSAPWRKEHTGGRQY